MSPVMYLSCWFPGGWNAMASFSMSRLLKWLRLQGKSGTLFENIICLINYSQGQSSESEVRETPYVIVAAFQDERKIVLELPMYPFHPFILYKSAPAPAGSLQGIPSSQGNSCCPLRAAQYLDLASDFDPFQVWPWARNLVTPNLTFLIRKWKY